MSQTKFGNYPCTRTLSSPSPFVYWNIYYEKCSTKSSKDWNQSRSTLLGPFKEGNWDGTCRREVPVLLQVKRKPKCRERGVISNVLRYGGLGSLGAITVVHKNNNSNNKSSPLTLTSVIFNVKNTRYSTAQDRTGPTVQRHVKPSLQGTDTNKDQSGVEDPDRNTENESTTEFNVFCTPYHLVPDVLRPDFLFRGIETKTRYLRRTGREKDLPGYWSKDYGWSVLIHPDFPVIIIVFTMSLLVFGTYIPSCALERQSLLIQVYGQEVPFGRGTTPGTRSRIID